ncbi:unnamed protein product [Sphagnum compactum]
MRMGFALLSVSRRLARQGLGGVWDNYFSHITEEVVNSSHQELHGIPSLIWGVDKDLLRQGGTAIAWWNTLYKQLPFPSICRLPLQEMQAHGRHYGSFALGQGHTHSGSFQTNPFITGGMRFKSNKSAKKRIARKKKRKVLRGKIHELKREKRARKANMTPEEILVSRIDMLKKKVALHEDQLKKYKLPDFPEPDPDPEIVSAAQLYALKKLGYKNKNYLPVGRRGIYGGTIQNMHLHWKKHETVQIRCDTFAKEKLQGMGEQLERLSGGIMVDIHEANKTIVMWRGRNYKRPSSLIPAVFDHFNKRKALLKSKHEQAIASLNDNISKWEKDLRELQAHMAEEAATRAERDAEIQSAPVTDPQQFSVLQEREADKESDSPDVVGANELDFKDWREETDSDSESDISCSDEPDGLHSDEYSSSSDSDDENSNKHVLGLKGVRRSAD